MRNFTRFMTGLSLGMVAAIGAPALAQTTTAAASDLKLDPGTMIYDPEGKEIGPVASSDGTNVVITVGGKQVALPKTSFMAGDKGPAITLTLAQLTAWLDQQAAASASALDAALTPGADIRSAKGAAIVGKVKSSDAEGVVVTTAQGDVRLPKNAFFMSQQGLATSFTADQFAAAIAEVAGSPAEEAVADAQDAAASESAPAPVD